MMDETMIVFGMGAALAGVAALAWPIVYRSLRIRHRASQAIDRSAVPTFGTRTTGGQETAFARQRLTDLRADANKAASQSDDALIRWVGLLGGPFLILMLIEFGVLDVDSKTGLMLAVATAAAGYLAPGLIHAVHRGQISARHRRAFPDILDWILICIDSGLGFEDAIERVARQAMSWDRTLGADWTRLSAEIKVGRPVADALGAFAVRVGVPDIAAFASTLGQWRELGISVSDALRGHVEDFRERRLIEAEAAAQKLPAKLVLPIGLFIFPVILVVIMLPAALGFAALKF